MTSWTAHPSTRLHRFVAVQRITGFLLMIFSFTMVPPIVVDQLYEGTTTGPFLTALWITFVTGAVIWWPARKERAELKTRDGFLITVLFWAVLGIFGAIPLILTHAAWHSYTDAIFESVSGLTTTGATTVARGLDDLPHALNFYRAQLHWLGGMGIIVLAVAVLPMLGVGGMQLYRAETPGPMKNAKLTPRITETARVLWLVYVTLTAVCGLVYYALGMTAFDAVIHALSTLATGGFSSHDASIGFFQNPILEWAVMLFMLLGTINFATHFAVWRSRSVRSYWRDSEFRTSLSVILLFSALVALPLILTATFSDPLVSVRKSVFHVISYGTTTGFTTSDSSVWPSYAPLMLILAGFMVGCAGSTSGGVKMVRLMLFVKQAMREVKRLVHPSAQLPIKLEGKVVDDAVVYAVGGFFSVYIGFTIVLTFAMISTGLDPVVAFSAVSACINNMGPGLGPLAGSMAGVSEAGKWILIFTMLLGRLEIFTLLIVLNPGFWRRW
ncbi:trk system potassium uptake protein TrkH [Panacagrimonas perspica]|uniref:Trk system potassium uptake protein n=1 Tax=Panacagrimonas perspica TaxID=381431 RepID=A0A4R7NWL5_9GAMM|nr:TrkH family potassium uptake protein [Panacagrimonas perspica]TDU25594.1 trk system potassium uptake protein TrkH [Panacagrimonas perspica]THD03808.1 potassium transporter [Panacagrimonas perspica]